MMLPETGVCALCVIAGALLGALLVAPLFHQLLAFRHVAGYP